MPDYTILHDVQPDGTVWWDVIDRDGNVVRSFASLLEAEEFCCGEGE